MRLNFFLSSYEFKSGFLSFDYTYTSYLLAIAAACCRESLGEHRRGVFIFCFLLNSAAQLRLAAHITECAMYCHGEDTSSYLLCLVLLGFICIYIYSKLDFTFALYFEVYKDLFSFWQ